MALHVVAAEVTISRPQTPLGWLFFASAIVLVLYLLNQGLDSITGSFQKPLFGTFLLLVAIFVIYMVAADEGRWKSDPVGRVEILPNGIQGTEASTDPAPAADSYD